MRTMTAARKPAESRVSLGVSYSSTTNFEVSASRRYARDSSAPVNTSGLLAAAERYPPVRQIQLSTRSPLIPTREATRAASSSF